MISNLAKIVRDKVIEKWPSFAWDDLENDVHYSYESLRKFFVEQYDIPIGVYVRRVKIIYAYHLWEKDGAKTIAKSDSYKGFSGFRQKFEDEFGMDIYEAHAKGETMEDYYFDKTIIRACKDVLREAETTGLIDGFAIVDDIVEIQTSPKRLLAFELETPSIILPSSFVKRNHFSELSNEAKCLMLYFAVKDERVVSNSIEGEICIEGEPEEMMNFFTYAKLLNLSNPNCFEECSIFCLPIADYEKEEFFLFIDSILDKTIFYIKGEMLANAEVRFLYTWFMMNKDKLIINQLATDNGRTINEAKELLWKYTQLGVLRYEGALKSIV